MSELTPDLFFTREQLAVLDAIVDTRIEKRLRDRLLLTVSEFSSKSGLSEKAIRHRVERGQLQYVKNGGRILIPVTALR